MTQLHDACGPFACLPVRLQHGAIKQRTKDKIEEYCTCLNEQNWEKLAGLYRPKNWLTPAEYQEKFQTIRHITVKEITDVSAQQEINLHHLGMPIYLYQIVTKCDADAQNGVKNIPMICTFEVWVLWDETYMHMMIPVDDQTEEITSE